MSSTLAERVRATMATKGFNQDQLEKEAELSKGYLSRILSGERRNLGPAIIDRLASALDVGAPWLASGLNITAEMGPLLDAVRAVPNLQVVASLPHAQPGQAQSARLRLDQVSGYFDAEFEVGRLEPQIPHEVFREARATTFGRPPETVTVEFLRDHVRFLNHHLNPGAQRESGTRSKPSNSETRVPQRSESRARSSSSDERRSSAHGSPRVTQTKKRPA
jgi:transcriptional regulator with XRE-family HTH domain